MVRKLSSLVLVALFTFSLAGLALGDQIKGKIAKVEDDGRWITVEAKDGKQEKIKISGSRTTIEGKISDRDDFKVGQKVTVEYGERKGKQEAKKVKVK